MIRKLGKKERKKKKAYIGGGRGEGEKKEKKIFSKLREGKKIKNIILQKGTDTQNGYISIFPPPHPCHPSIIHHPTCWKSTRASFFFVCFVLFCFVVSTFVFVAIVRSDRNIVMQKPRKERRKEPKKNKRERESKDEINQKKGTNQSQAPKPVGTPQTSTGRELRSWRERRERERDFKWLAAGPGTSRDGPAEDPGSGLGAPGSGRIHFLPSFRGRRLRTCSWTSTT